MLILAALPLVCLLIAATTASLAMRRWRAALTTLLLALLLNSWSESIALRCGHRNEAQLTTHSSRRLRVMTYNVWGNSPYLKASKSDAHGAWHMVAMVDSLYPDILLLPEYNRTFSSPLGDTLSTRYAYNSRRLMSDIGRGEIHVYSHYPILDLTRFTLAVDTLTTHPTGDAVGEARWTEVWWMTTVIDGIPTKLVYCHLRSNDYTVARRHTARGFAHWGEGIRSYYIGLREGYRQRDIEAHAIADSLATWDGPIIVAGDMNDVGGSTALRTLEASGLHDAWWAAGCGFGFTYAAYHLRLRLDHILYNDDFSIGDVKVVNAPFSDHYPLVADLYLNTNNIAP